MKNKLTLLAWLAGVSLAGAQTLITNSYTVTPPGSTGVVPDGNPVGITETFNVSGVTGPIADMQIQLDITGGFNGDLYATLAGPGGQLAVLLNRVGVNGSNPFGYSDAGMNITLDGNALNNIHDYQNTPGYNLSGTTWAADGRNIDPQTPGGTLETTATTSGLSIFDTLAANGTWTLFIADLSPGGGNSTLQYSTMTVMSVPEPDSWVMIVSGLAVLFGVGRWRQCGRA